MPERGLERSVERAVRDAAAQLSAAGVEGALRGARLLVSDTAGMTLEQLLAHPEAVVTGDVQLRLSERIARRCSHEPVSRILGWREFYGRRFDITPDVLDPRADTETLVDVALRLAADRQATEVESAAEAPLRILDIGTGSGALLVSILAELPTATGVGLDISAAALTVARSNAERLGVSGRCTFELCDVLADPLAASLINRRFDLIVSNPPYVTRDEMAALTADVSDFDPHVALDGGCDGLLFYRRIAAISGRLASAGAWLVLEVGYQQAASVLKILVAAAGGPANREHFVQTDLTGHARCVAFQVHPAR